MSRARTITSAVPSTAGGRVEGGTTVDVVLEGGGAKGIALVGAIVVLEERGFNFARVARTSADAIVGPLVASGMTSSALHDLMIEVDSTRFRDETPTGHLPVLGCGLSIWLEHGMYRGESFRG